jgi:predicted dehydrogenase
MPKLRIGLFGGGRGAGLARPFADHPHAEIVAVCEKDPDRAERCRRVLPRPTYYAEFDEFLGHDLDGVLLANYAHEHAPYAVRAMDRGLHVVSEVLACSTLAEGVALARAVERNGVVYSYAENYCFFRHTLEMRRLYRDGALGQFLYGECEYAHDCEAIWPMIAYGDPNHWRNWTSATFYCTHSLGPIVKITGTRPKRVVGFTTPNALGRRYGRRADDIGLIVCQVDNGAVVKSLKGPIKREPSAIWYQIAGTKGSVENSRWPPMEQIHVYLEDSDPPYRTYLPEFPPDMRPGGGHGGSDLAVIEGFIRCILFGEPNPIDVYEALDMTLPGILAFRSAYEGTVPYEVPDFRDESTRRQHENDNWSCDPKYTGPGQPTSSSAYGIVEVAEGVYAEQRRRYRAWLEGRPF